MNKAWSAYTRFKMTLSKSIRQVVHSGNVGPAAVESASVAKLPNDCSPLEPHMRLMHCFECHSRAMRARVSSRRASGVKRCARQMRRGL
jgi:hypothetical protein